MTAVAAILLLASAAAAQEGPYVAGSATLDVVRVDHSEAEGGQTASGQGEAPGGLLRLGTGLGDRWGVELDYAWSGVIDADNPISSFIQTAPIGTITNVSVQLLPFFTFSSERHHSSLAPTLWFRQRLGNSSDLAFLGGLAFTRVVTESEFSLGPVLGIPELGIPARLPIRQASRSVDYGVEPLVGVEGRIGLTEKLRLVAGVRLQGLVDGWLLRPSVGVGWFF